MKYKWIGFFGAKVHAFEPFNQLPGDFSVCGQGRYPVCESGAQTDGDRCYFCKRHQSRDALLGVAWSPPEVPE